jgi:hypothetical protein
MTRSASAPDFAKTTTNKTDPQSNVASPNHLALVNKIKDLFPKYATKALSTWLRISIETARHRMKASREFNLDEVVELLHDAHGFKILKALMERAERKPRWWLVCEPLMELADIEVMAAEARRRTRNVIHKREQVIDALETEIRRTQTLAIHDQEHASAHADALRSLRPSFVAAGGVVAPRRR